MRRGCHFSVAKESQYSISPSVRQSAKDRYLISMCGISVANQLRSFWYKECVDRIAMELHRNRLHAERISRKSVSWLITNKASSRGLSNAILREGGP